MASARALLRQTRGDTWPRIHPAAPAQPLLYTIELEQLSVSQLAHAAENHRHGSSAAQRRLCAALPNWNEGCVLRTRHPATVSYK